MYVLFNLENNRPVETEVVDKLHAMLKEYRQTISGKWLADITIEDYSLMWCEDLSMANGRNGAYTLYPQDIIYLRPPDGIMMEGLSSAWIGNIATALIHELKHAHQHVKYGMLYSICCFPIIRDYTFEIGAKQEAKKARDFFKHISNRY